MGVILTASDGVGDDGRPGDGVSGGNLASFLQPSGHTGVIRTLQLSCARRRGAVMTRARTHRAFVDSFLLSPQCLI